MVKGADRLLALAGLAATRARADLARALADVRAAEAALAEAAARSRTGLPEGGTDAVALRLDTLARVRQSGMKVCAGGIVGLGETARDRAGLLQALANLPTHPESVPINNLVKVAGTPLADAEDIDPFDFIRTIAAARILMPASHVRLSAGRETMNEALQALAFFAGANSIFYGDKLLTTGNPAAERDRDLLARLKINTARPLYYDAAASA